MTAIELNRILCQRGIQYRQSGQYMLYAPYARMGLAQNRITAYPDMFATLHTTSRLVWTESGSRFKTTTVGLKQNATTKIRNTLDGGAADCVVSQFRSSAYFQTSSIALRTLGACSSAG